MPRAWAHAVCSLDYDSAVMYHLRPGFGECRQPAHPELCLVLPEGVTPVLSAKDAAAPSLSQAVAQGLPPPV